MVQWRTKSSEYHSLQDGRAGLSEIQSNMGVHAEGKKAGVDQTLENLTGGLALNLALKSMA